MKEMARSLLHHASLPPSFWGEAVATSVHILNRSLTKAVDGLTPYEVFTGCKPNVSHFRVFGCVAHVHVPLIRGGVWKLNLKNSFFVVMLVVPKDFGFGILLWAI